MRTARDEQNLIAVLALLAGIGGAITVITYIIQQVFP